jgi:hypothetical protein
MLGICRCKIEFEEFIMLITRLVYSIEETENRINEVIGDKTIVIMNVNSISEVHKHNAISTEGFLVYTIVLS